ncbi:MAG: hypothetical protein JSR14_12320 [Proteobacteria bacterium]|nr:hypothetical protein [Pseudomonadota bacterium]
MAATHLVMPPGLGSGTPLIQHGRHGVEGRDAGVALSPFLGCALLDRVS